MDYWYFTICHIIFKNVLVLSIPILFQDWDIKAKGIFILSLIGFIVISSMQVMLITTFFSNAKVAGDIGNLLLALSSVSFYLLFDNM